MENVVLSSKLSKIVSGVQEYVDSHIGESIAVKDIAKALKLNASYLNSSFKDQAGECITKYIQKVKIKEAMSMLKKTQFSITDIWTSLGYFDQSHFNKHFKKITGITPKQYRRQHISKEKIHKE